MLKIGRVEGTRRGVHNTALAIYGSVQNDVGGKGESGFEKRI
jgi:hypothetical protein